MSQEEMVVAIKRVAASHERIHAAVKEANLSVYDTWLVEAMRKTFIEALAKIFEKGYH